MRLVSFISLRLSLIAAVVVALWSVLFYFAMIDEVNDEVDDSLEDFAEMIILRSLGGEPLPSEPTGSNNQYYLREVTTEYAAGRSHIRYEDRMVYIKEKSEYEPARVLSYIYVTDAGQYMEVEVSVPTIDKSDLKEAIFYHILFLYIAITLAIIILNIYTVRNSMRPLRRLLDKIDRYKPGGKRFQTDDKTMITEFRKLNEAVSRMSERSDTAYRQQKLFIGNASHEMQTPIAVCQSRLEMLLEDETLTEQQMGEIIKTLATLDNLSKLNRSLLLLCKIENGQFQDIETVDLTEIARSLTADYALLFDSKNIHSDIAGEAHFTVVMSRQLADVLVSNLLKNAFAHTADGGRITITSAADSLSIANSADGEPLDEQKIFTRFYHTQGSKTSTGLGLPIAKAVCDLYAINISYRFRSTPHSAEACKAHVFRLEKRADSAR